jgi:hypothetical protein
MCQVRIMAETDSGFSYISSVLQANTGLAIRLRHSHNIPITDHTTIPRYTVRDTDSVVKQTSAICLALRTQLNSWNCAQMSKSEPQQ